MKIFFSILAALMAQSALAVPVPWKNCGVAGDIFSVSKSEAAIWAPRPGMPPFWVWGVAKLNPDTAQLEEFRAALIGPSWVFELDHPDENIRAENGFVALPDSWLVHGSPALHVTTDEFEGLPATSIVPWRTSYPAPAGPINFGVSDPLPPLSPLGLPNTYAVQGNLATAVTPVATISLAFNGKSGFPVDPLSFGPSSFRFEVTSQETGKGVICIEETLPESAMVAILPVKLRDFNPFKGKGETELSWNYDDHRPSAAMDPTVLFRPCGAAQGSDEKALGERYYDFESGTWSFAWNAGDLEDGCYEIRIQSALTGQIDGPFETEQ